VSYHDCTVSRLAALIGGTLLFVLSCRPFEASPDQTPTASAPVSAPTGGSVLIIVTDDQRWNWPMPPKIRQLLGPEAVQFTRHYVATALCCPTRTTILTGLYSHNTGVLSNELPYGGAAKFDPSQTLAVWASSAGVRTGLFGKYLNQTCKIPPGAPPGWSIYVGWRQGGTSCNTPGGQYRSFSYDSMGAVRTNTRDYSTNFYGSRAVSFINQTPAGQPLLLYFAPNAPHGEGLKLPVPASSADLTPFLGEQEARDSAFNWTDTTGMPTWVKQLPPLTATNIARIDNWRRYADATMLAVDRQVAAIIGALKTTGRWNSTLVILISDNGIGQGSHKLQQDKDAAYEASQRTTLWIRVPGITGRQESALVSDIDIAPTVMEWLQLPITTYMVGQSLLPTISGAGSPHTAILLEELGYTLHGTTILDSTRNYSGVVRDSLKYVAYWNGDEELYNLNQDPAEIHNLVRDSTYAGPLDIIKSDLALLKSQ